MMRFWDEGPSKAVNAKRVKPVRRALVQWYAKNRQKIESSQMAAKV
jgi:hypothetical protein